jgi:hypothetical protein
VNVFETEELVEYIKTGMRVAKPLGLENEFLVSAIGTLLPRSLDLDGALEKVRQIAINLDIIEDEE